MKAASLKIALNLLLDNFWQIITKQKQLIWINSGYSQIAIIFPFVVAMPTIFGATDHPGRIDADLQCFWPGARILILLCRYVLVHR
jgi:ABC-type uncharacterized transport system fused permease/ATPase subunit